MVDDTPVVWRKQPHSAPRTHPRIGVTPSAAAAIDDYSLGQVALIIFTDSTRSFCCVLDAVLLVVPAGAVVLVELDDADSSVPVIST
jgi:hypothetical protein